jgi:hypothetical protein
LGSKQYVKAGRSCRAGLLQVVIVLSGYAAAAAQTAGFKAADLRPVERIVLDLAAAGLTEDSARVRAALVNLGASSSQVQGLDRKLDRQRKPDSVDVSRLDRIADSARKAAIRLGQKLDSIDDVTVRSRAAYELLRISHDVEAAHEALGHVRSGDAWLTAEQSQMQERKREVFAALATIRSFPIQVSVSESRHPLLLMLDGRPGISVTANGVTMHSHWPEAKVRRVIIGALHSLSLSDYLMTGRGPALRANLKYEGSLTDVQIEYLAQLRSDIASNETDAGWEPWSNMGGYYRRSGFEVGYAPTELYAQSGLFTHLSGAGSGHLLGDPYMPTLVAGHANWVTMAVLGAALPPLYVAQSHVERPRTSAKEASPITQYLAGAGLMGARSWLRRTIVDGDDPPWSRSFKRDVGLIDGEDLLKATFIAEYLHLKPSFGRVMKLAAGGASGDSLAMGSAIESAVGATVLEFEDSWRRWMVGADQNEDLVGRLSSLGANGVDRPEVLQALQEVRALAFSHPWLQSVPAVELASELSRGSQAHAEYLLMHPEQMAAWPDAHEEFIDREGFSPEGSWAGSHSVIAPGVRDAEGAVAAWMGTFFHRLPLIDPGLLQVGWAIEKGVAVLDSGSVVRKIRNAWEVAWPPDGMKDVPRRFRPELPSPFPGEDQSAWGYPITLQLGLQEGEGIPEIAMSVRRGHEDGPLVEGRLTSPQNPGNPRLVPDLSWCFIPSAALQPNERYFVRVEFLRGKRGVGGTLLEWQFETAR